LKEARKANKPPISNYIKKFDEIFLMCYVRFNQITSITYNNKKRKEKKIKVAIESPPFSNGSSLGS
jgi:hypothetical protein